MKLPMIPATPRKGQANQVKCRKKSVYTPDVMRLKKNFKEEFEKFLKSLKLFTDGLEATRTGKLLVLERKLKRFHRKSSQFELKFKSMIYWKTFYIKFIEKADEIIQLFRLDDLRDIDVAIESANLHSTIVPFVRDNLRSWREIFADKKWMIEYKTSMDEYIKVSNEMAEDEERCELIKSIMKDLDKYEIDIEDLEKEKEKDNENMVEIIRRKIEEKKRLMMAENQLKQLPITSKKTTTREWCEKHYKNASTPAGNSDEEQTLTPNSSIYAEDGGDQRSEVSSEDGILAEESVMSGFFTDAGL